MYNLFTQTAQEVLRRAEEESRKRNHLYVGTEHILLAILALERGVARGALWSLKVDLAALKAALDAKMPQAEETATSEKLPRTNHAKLALELAGEEAKCRRCHYVDTGYLLLGLMGEGVAGGVLRSCGLESPQLRAVVHKLTSESDDLAVPDSSVSDEELGRLFRCLLIEAGYSEKDIEQFPAAIDAPSIKDEPPNRQIDLLMSHLDEHSRRAMVVGALRSVLTLVPVFKEV